MNSNTSFDWNDERVELTKKLFHEGQSAGQIAKALGHGLTRCAVSGKLHRMGLLRGNQLLSSSRRSNSCQPKSRKVTKAARVAGAAGPPLPAGAALVAEPVELPPEPQGTVTVLTVASRHVCRWPIGDPLSEDFTMCGRATQGKGSFCPQHAQVAYKPTPPRKDKELASLARMMRRFA